MPYIVLFWGGMILVVVGAIVWGVLAEKKRREALAKTVEELGLRLASDLEDSDRKMFDAYQLAQQGHSRQASNVIVADSGELRMVLFDYLYKTNSGKNSTTYKQSVVLVRSPALRMPEFTISPEGFFHRILAIFGVKDIDFEEDREFSDNFLLQGRKNKRCAVSLMLSAESSLPIMLTYSSKVEVSRFCIIGRDIVGMPMESNKRWSRPSKCTAR